MRINETIAVVLLCLALAVTVQAEESGDDRQKNVTPNAIPIDDVDDNKGDEVCHYWGNSFSLKFHVKSCPFAQAMNPRHVQFLKTVQEALTLGEKPCRYCLPPYELSVSCKILNQPIGSNQSDNSADRKAPETAN